MKQLYFITSVALCLFFSQAGYSDEQDDNLAASSPLEASTASDANTKIVKACTKPEDCDSRKCDGGNCVRGEQNVGADCQHPDMCRSKKCGKDGKCLWGDSRIGSTVEQVEECASGKWQDKKCIRGEKNVWAPCTHNDMCRSLVCDTETGWCNWGNTKANEACEQNEECISRSCTNNVCRLLSDGEECIKDSACASGFCETYKDAFTRGGKCSAPK